MKPEVGSFIHPVGSYRYSIRVGLHGSEGRVYGDRWGLKNGFPFDDGHTGHGNMSCIDLEPTTPGVWRDAVTCWDEEPRVWVDCTHPGQQRELLA